MIKNKIIDEIKKKWDLLIIVFSNSLNVYL